MNPHKRVRGVKEKEEEEEEEGTVIIDQRKTFKSMGSPLESTANVSLSFTSLKKKTEKTVPTTFTCEEPNEKMGGSSLSPVSPLYHPSLYPLSHAYRVLGVDLSASPQQQLACVRVAIVSA